MPTSSRAVIAFTIAFSAIALWFCIAFRSGSDGATKAGEHARAAADGAGASKTPDKNKGDSSARERVKNALAGLPLNFEVNHGQTNEEVKYLSRGRGYALFLCEQEAVLSLQQPRHLENGRPSGAPPPAVLRLGFVDSNPHPAIRGEGMQGGKSNYFLGTRSITDVALYSKVEYAGVYPGIDAVYYGNQKQLEYDFVVGPGADPSAIKLAVSGADKAELNARGDLVLSVGGREVCQHKPNLYQVTDGAKQEVAGHYVLHEANASGTRLVSFEVAGYDKRKPLVIDPVLVYSTYFGDKPHTDSSDHSGDEGGMGIAIDASGNAYVTGFTNSIEFPVQGAVLFYTDPLLHPQDGPHVQPFDYHAFLMKFNQDASLLVYSTYWGGSVGGGNDVAVAVAVDANNEPCIAGTTTSSDFPMKNAVHVYAGGIDTFLTKFNAAANNIIFSTYLGGSGDDVCNDLALDRTGNIFVVGTTNSTNLATANPIQPQNNSAVAGTNGFVAKFTPDGTVVLFSTYLGGRVSDGAMGVTTDSSGNCYVAGFASSPDFPMASPLQPKNAGGKDAFVAKLNSSGTLIVFSTYLGGDSDDQANGVAVDAGGNVYLAGSSASRNFPTVSPTVLPVQSSNGGPPGTKDAFVSKINNLGNTLIFSTYLGGAGNDEARRIVVDSRNAIYVAGSTDSDDFPLAPQANTLQSGRAGGVDGFIAKFNPTGTPLVYSTYFGSGTHEFVTDNMAELGIPGVTRDTRDEVRGLTADNQGNAYVTGFTEGAFYYTFGAYSGRGLPLLPVPGDDYPAPFVLFATDANGAIIPEPAEAGPAASYLTTLTTGKIAQMLPSTPAVITASGLVPPGPAGLNGDVYGIDDRDVYLSKVGDSSPLLTSPQTAIGSVGVPFNYIITATNNPTSFDAAGLPPGFVVSTSTGQIAGTAGAPGTFRVVLTASNASGTGSEILVLNISAGPPTITSSLTASAVVGQVFSYTITASNFPASFDAQNLPPSLGVDHLSGLISGVPLNEGLFSVTLIATNAVGQDTKTLSLTVMPAVPVITSPSVAQGVLNVPFSYTITATGNPSSFAATGLPPGLSVVSTTGVISGTPTTLGSFNVGLSASNGGGTGTASLSLSIIPALVPVITSADTAFAVVGQSFAYRITANNNPLTFAITEDATVTAVLSGTQFTAAGLINEGPFVGHPLTITSGASVNQTALVMAFNRATGDITTDIALTLSVNDTFYIRVLPLALTPHFLGGLTLDTTNGTISGTPTVNSAGRPFHLTMRATNAAGTGTRGLQLIVYKPERPFISSPATSTGIVGTPFEYDIGANGPTTGALGQITAVGASLFSSTDLLNSGPFAAQRVTMKSGGATNLVWTITAFDPLTGTCTLDTSTQAFTGLAGDNFLIDIPSTINNPANAVNGFVTTLIGVTQFQSEHLNGVTADPSLPNPLVGQIITMTSGAAANQTRTVTAFDPVAGTVTINAAFAAAVSLSDGIAVGLQPFNASGLPPSNNLTINTNTGAITGTPAAVDANTNPGWPVLVQASNSAGTGTLLNPDLTPTTMTLVIDPLAVPQITSPGKASGVAGVAFSYTITATNGPTSFNAAPLPAGLGVNTVTGLINGTPQAPGVYSVTLSATNAIGTGTLPLQLTIFAPNPPVITSPLTANGIDGAPFSYTITATGTTPMSFDAQPLPPGLAVNSVTGGIVGRPSLPGTFNVTLSVSNPATQPTTPAVPPTTATLVIHIQPTAPVITNPPPLTATGTVGVPFSYTVTATGTQPVTLSAAPLPPGLTLSVGAVTGVASPTQLDCSDLIGPTAAVAVGQPITMVTGTAAGQSHTVTAFDGTIGRITFDQPFSSAIATGDRFMVVFSRDGITQAVISGIPLPAAVGSTAVTLGAANPVQPQPNTVQLTITILAAKPAITSPLAVSAMDGKPFSYTITATGTPYITFKAVFPPNLTGLTFTGTTIFGTPANSIGSFNVTLTATNAGGTDTETLVIAIAPAPPTITSLLTATAQDGKPFSYTITASGTPPFTFSLSPQAPAPGSVPGLTLQGANITGTPVGTGTYTVVIGATNSVGGDTKNLVITVQPAPPTITSSLTASASDGAPFTYTITASGTAPIIFGAGNLPAGLALQGAVISGTPSGPGTTNINLSATNAAGTDNKTLVLTVLPAPPVITDSSGTNFRVTGTPGVSFSYTITATGTLPITFLAGNLPPGLTQSGALISGSPTQAGTTNVTLQATNTFGQDTRTLVIDVVLNPPTITSPLTAIGSDGVRFSYTITATGSIPMTFGASPLPPGLNINPATGVISGTPTQPGVTNVTITATNSVAPFTDTKILRITIQPSSPAITSPASASGLQGQQFTYTITATGTPTITFGATGLPTGLALNGAVISGIPVQTGTFAVQLTASNAVGTVTKTLTLSITAVAPVITSPATAIGYLNNAFTYTITASNLPTSFGASGLPPSLALDTDTGVISGLPIQTGTFQVTLSASNVGGTGTATLTLTISSGAPAITSPLTVSATAGIPFTYQITANGVAPMTFSAAPLPPGLTLSSGVISGTPTTDGTFTVQLTANNSAGTDVESLVIIIAAEPDDLDGDGFPNELETALGTDPLSPASTPFDGKPVVDQAMSVTSMNIKLDFTTSGKDIINIQGTFPLNEAVSPAGEAITLVVGGIVQRFTLNAHGSARSGGSTLSLRIPRQMLRGRFTAKFSGDFKQALSAAGLTRTPAVILASRTVRVFLLTDKTALYDSKKLLSYTVRAGRFGIAKAAKTQF